MSVSGQTQAQAGLAALRRFLDNLRQNHALEHATIHIISQSAPQLQLMGRSAPSGFYLYARRPPRW